MKAKLYKIVVLMSRLTIYMMIVCQASTMAFAIGSAAQRLHLNEIEIELSVQSEPQKLLELISEIESKSDFKFAYSKSEIKSKKVLLTKKRWNMNALLKSISSQTRMSIRRVNETIALSTISENSDFPDVMEKLVAKSTVTGKITDSSGDALPGATVLEKGTTNGTVSDFEGSFSISVDPNAILTISFIGYETQEISVQGRSVIDVTLADDIEALEEVVVVGYGTVKKSDLTGSVSSVSAKDLNKTVNQSFVEALDGRASGVKIQSGEGTPGGDISIRIRGGTSISASNEPLYVIDGFPIVVERSVEGYDAEASASTSSSALSGIDPKDIESIQILKDASATAIYGSRGANGVVIITTKKGRAGKATLSFDAFVSSQTVTNKIDVADGVEYAEYQRARLALADSPDPSAVEFFSNPESFAGISRDWQDEIFRTAFIKNYRVGLNGGSEKVQYNISLGSFLNDGVVEGSSFDRFNARANLNGNLSEKLRFSAVLTGSYSEQAGVPTGGSNGNNQGIITSALLSAPFTIDQSNPAAANLYGQQFAPDRTLAGTESLNKTDFFQGNLSLDYDIVKGLTFKTLVGATTTGFRSALYQSTETSIGALNNGRATLGQNHNRSWLTENTLNYTKDAGVHSISALIGTTYQTATIENFQTINTDFVVEDLGFNAIGIGTSTIIPTSSLEEWAVQSGLARLNYGYDDRYLLTASFRADGSSRFAEGEKWGFFPAGAFAWKINNEDFLKTSSVVTDLKLRVGYGITGNQEVPRYRSLSALTSGFYAFGLDNGTLTTALNTGRVANPDLTWETTKQLNFGLDFGVFNHKLSGSIDFYSKKTEDMLLEVFLNPTAGITNAALRNIGSLQNNGLEIALSSVNVETKDFSWTTDFNISFNQNEILDLGENDEIFFDAQGGWHQIENEIILREGESIGSFYGFETGGIDEDGSRIFIDQDGDTEITDADRVIIGNALPIHYGGITNRLSYKGFDLSIFFNWSYGNDVYNANRVYYEEISDLNNRSIEGLNYWTPENSDSDISAIDQVNPEMVDRLIEDGSFIRLKNVTLGYTFNDDILGKTPFSFARIYVSGQNLWTGTNYSGYNPEANVSALPIAPGIDWGAYPLARIFTAGLNVKF